MRRSNYSIVRQDKEQIVLSDDGPWDQHPTITNDAENVIEDLRPVLNGRRVLYYDSEGELTELCHQDGVFKGFA